jgi:CheY-like chemotaxis protein
VTIRASAEVDTGTAVVSVHDTGVGMEPCVLAHLFEPFMQADRSLDRSRGGLGLGLALVKGLIDLHGGSVAAHSDGPGQGSTLAFRLPLTTTLTAPVPRAQAAGPRGGLRVLIIEDNRDAAESLRMLLSLDGHQVATAFDGPTGLRRARDLRPHVVFCDIELPRGMDGYTVARALRADPDLTPMHLIALTGYAQEEDLRLAREAGFDQHLVKPAEHSALSAALASVPRRG